METTNPLVDDCGRCLNCGRVHPPCAMPGCNNRTHCPHDEHGEPFLYCDSCDAGMANLDVTQGDVT